MGCKLHTDLNHLKVITHTKVGWVPCWGLGYKVPPNMDKHRGQHYIKLIPLPLPGSMYFFQCCHTKYIKILYTNLSQTYSCVISMLLYYLCIKNIIFLCLFLQKACTCMGIFCWKRWNSYGFKWLQLQGAICVAKVRYTKTTILYVCAWMYACVCGKVS